MSRPTNLSSELRAAAELERGIVAERVDELREQAERLHALAEAADGDLAASLRLLAQLDEMLGLAPQMSMTDVDDVLRGQRLRQVAIQVLKKRRERTAEVHYKEWYALLVEEGHRVAGKDPVATFLTQVSRSPEVEKVGRRSGKYRLVAVA